MGAADGQTAPCANPRMWRLAHRSTARPPSQSRHPAAAPPSFLPRPCQLPGALQPASGAVPGAACPRHDASRARPPSSTVRRLFPARRSHLYVCTYTPRAASEPLCAPRAIQFRSPQQPHTHTRGAGGPGPDQLSISVQTGDVPPLAAASPSRWRGGKVGPALTSSNGRADGPRGAMATDGNREQRPLFCRAVATAVDAHWGDDHVDVFVTVPTYVYKRFREPRQTLSVQNPIKHVQRATMTKNPAQRRGAACNTTHGNGNKRSRGIYA